MLVAWKIFLSYYKDNRKDSRIDSSVVPLVYRGKYAFQKVEKIYSVFNSVNSKDHASVLSLTTYD